MKAKYNPFNPNSVVTPRLFAGRSLQVHEICKKLGQLEHGMPASFFIFGERGIGKTALATLIKYLAKTQKEELIELNLVTSYYSAEKGQSVGSILQESVNKLTDEMGENVLLKIGKRLGDLFKNGKFQIGAFGAEISADLSAESAQKEIAIKDQTVSILTNIVKSLQENEEDKKHGLLIIIDEVHNINDLQSLASIIRNIVTTLTVDGLGSVAFLLIGYKEDVDKFFSEDSSAKRLFDLHELSVMPLEEAAELLKKSLDEVEIEYEDNILRTAAKIAGGYPHSLQMLGYHLVEVDSDGIIDKLDLRDAITATAMDLRTKDFSDMYSFSGGSKQSDQLLELLAQENTPLTKKALNDRLSFSNVYHTLGILKRSGAIREDEEGKIHLQSQLFRTAILMNMYIRGKMEEFPSAL